MASTPSLAQATTAASTVVNIVTPSAGTCAVSSSAIAGQWIDGVSYGDSIVDLTKVGVDASYNIAGWNGVQDLLVVGAYRLSI